MGRELFGDGELDNAPRVPVAHGPVEGDDREYLLPVTELAAPIRVEFDLWQNSSPRPQLPEILWLYREGDVEPIGEKQWTAPISLDELFIEVEMGQWSDGKHAVYYRVQLFNGSTSRSKALTVWIDRVAPGAGDALKLPQDLNPAETVTAHYLETHGDRLEVTFEPPAELIAGDTLRFYWNPNLSGGGEDEDYCVDDWTLTAADVAKPLLSYAFGGQVLRERGDGIRYAYYRIKDRAGNAGGPSWPAAVSVAAAPIPRDLPPPRVHSAAGTPPRQSLDPAHALDGVTVEVPESAVIYDDEHIALSWHVPGAAGGWASDRLAATIRPWTFTVPATAVGAHLSGRLDIKYTVFASSEEAGTAATELSVGNLPGSHFPMVSCVEAEGMAYLSLARIQGGSATFRLERWVLMSTDQHVKLTVSGTLQAGGSYERVLVDHRGVTEAELTSGLTQPVAKADLELFARNSDIRLRAYVSWDRGSTWPPEGLPNFPVRSLLLKD